ncbi:hypothetical protein PGTUg99_025802 [Puccinia graminis f. sp. tritici]|uniref:Uncharacterized protein n=1 Tax=Puccinia graminis f. sp. tritici TaxID=56615 RepID=A0A5B0RML1_PUCGR|nr:hypothetical protein PGTUg99_025802 [Puccinia graminis f. sp. tritici]
MPSGSNYAPLVEQSADSSTNGRPTSAAMPTAGRHMKPAWEVAPTAAADTSRKEAHQNRWAGAGRLAPHEISRRPAVGRSSWCTCEDSGAGFRDRRRF